MISEIIQLILLAMIGGFSAFLGLLAYSNDPKKSLNRWFGIVSILLFMWVLFAYLGSVTDNQELSVFFYKFNLAAVSLFLFSFYFFLIPCFTGIRNKIMEKIILLFSIGFFLLSLFTDYIVEGVIPRYWGMEMQYGLLGDSYKLFSFFVVFFILYKLFKYYCTASKTEKDKTKYFFLGIFLFIIFNVTFNIIIPITLDTLRFVSLGDFSAIFLLLFAAYAIIRKKLFGIKILLTGFIVVLMFFVLSIDLFFFTKDLWMQIAKGAALLTFIAFGYALVKSVLREIEQKEELERLSDEIVEANVQLKEANRELKKLDKAKSEFMSIASHQLRTPLTAIKGYLSMILSGTYGEIKEPVKEKMVDVMHSNERLIGLVNDLLNVSRIESGKIEMNFKKVKADQFLQETIKELKIVAENKGLYLDFENQTGSEIILEMDPDRMRQVILNIIDNAIKYTQDGGVTVRLKTQKVKVGINSVLIEIDDTGEGMTQKDINNIFNSFARGSAGDLMHSEGAGLGLYIARKFVDMHNGNIWIESEGKGMGTRFIIELPIDQN